MVEYDFSKIPIVDLVDEILVYGVKNRASDIHFDPVENGLKIRMRIDGELRNHALVPSLYHKNLATRIKLISGMNITENRLPQDGAIKGQIKNIDMDMRVSCLPTNEGEKIVIRILDYSKSLEGIDSLGFSKVNFDKLQKMITVPNGIVLVTGATGTGKSTTTYSILQALNKENTNIITVEDPIEMNIEGVNQVQVNSEIGMTFASALRAILRQDPNIILIGEIRDPETAQIAIRASITGHLVLSTIHTNNSLTTIERLIDMGVERYLLSTSLTGIISQRLARKICEKCRVKRKTTEYEKKVFKKTLNQDIDEIYTINPDGCSECNGGYKGRIAVQEVLLLNDEVREAINSDVDRDELKKMVYRTDVITMLQDGLEKVLNGLTTFDEIYRIIDIDDEIDDEDGIYLAKAIASNQEMIKEEKKEKPTLESVPTNNIEEKKAEEPIIPTPIEIDPVAEEDLIETPISEEEIISPIEKEEIL